MIAFQFQAPSRSSIWKTRWQDRTLQVVGVLDSPSTDSLGLVGIVVPTGPVRVSSSLQYQVLGLQDSPRTISDSEFDLLCEEKVIRPISVSVPSVSGSRLGAVWVGTGFQRRCRELDVPFVDLAGFVSSSVADEAELFVGSSAQLFARLDSWLEAALRCSLEGRDPEIARLMLAVFPDRDETRVALVLTASQEDSETELELWSRNESLRGRVESRATLLARLRLLAENQLQVGETTPVELTPYLARLVCIRTLQRWSSGAHLSTSKRRIGELSAELLLATREGKTEPARLIATRLVRAALGKSKRLFEEVEIESTLRMVTTGPSYGNATETPSWFPEGAETVRAALSLSPDVALRTLEHDVVERLYGNQTDALLGYVDWFVRQRVRESIDSATATDLDLARSGSTLEAVMRAPPWPPTVSRTVARYVR